MCVGERGCKSFQIASKSTDDVTIDSENMSCLVSDLARFNLSKQLTGGSRPESNFRRY